jgi:hypothetical protein
MIQELCHQRWELLCKKLTRDVPAHVTIQADKLLDFYLQEHLNQLSDIQRNRGLQRLAGGEI